MEISKETIEKAKEILGMIKKSEQEEVLEKSGGPGSRGGNVVGTSSSGKPIYEGKHVTIHAPSEKGSEYTVVHNKTGEKWYMDHEGNGSIPEKYMDTNVEKEAKDAASKHHSSLNKSFSKEEIDAKKAEYASCMQKAKEFSDKAEALKAEIGAMGDPMGDDSQLLSHTKSDNADLIKAFDDRFLALTNLVNDKEKENNTLKKSIEALTIRVEEIAKQPVGPRSITSANAKDRFPVEAGAGERVLSIKNNRRELTAELIKAGAQDATFLKAASNMEITGAPCGAEDIDAMARRLRKELKIVLTA